MAGQWGNNTLASGQVAAWSFGRPNVSGFLPVLSVIPLSPSFTDGGPHVLETLDSVSFPTFNQLGISTIWTQLSNDGSTLIYYMLVMNFSPNPIQYAFLESDV
jgi:hypothetical protein